jgi:hypothetical protein
VKEINISGWPQKNDDKKVQQAWRKHAKTIQLPSRENVKKKKTQDTETAK